MAELSSFIISDKAEGAPLDTNKIVQRLINPKNSFVMQFLPTNYSFAVTFGVIGLKFDHEYDIKLILRDPNNNIIAQTNNLKYTARKRPNSLPEEGNGFMANINLENIVIKFEGLYTCTIRVDSKTVGEHRFFIYNKQAHKNGDTNASKQSHQ